MTAARDELHQLIDELPDDQVIAAAADLRRRLARERPQTSWPPPWFGSITAGRDDTSERVDEILAEGFGR